MAQRLAAFNLQVGTAYSRYAAGVAEGVELLAQTWARDVQAEARRLAPKDTGWLQSSISIAAGRRGDEIAAAVGTDCPHAPFVERGRPEAPDTMWATKRAEEYPNPFATMPYLRTARLHIESRFLAQLRKIGKEVS